MKKDILHLTSPQNWINDPNGFIYYKGWYHLFYQYFPYAPCWGLMHWGHAVSRDLIHWEHRGVALFPTKPEDQNGCFSGSAVEHDGKMVVYYTGVHYHQPDPENIHLCLNDDFTSTQMKITSEDGFTFDNFNGKQVAVPAIKDPSIGDRANTRDPKVWRGKHAWYMVLGSTTEEKKGELLVYKSPDLDHFELGSRISLPDAGWMWECPDYFEAGEGGVLVVSPMKLIPDGRLYGDVTICMKAEFEEESCTMKLSGNWQYLDYGLDLYAPQSTVDERGRRVLVAWLRMPESPDGKWIGMFCLPRIVERRNGHIYFSVLPEIREGFSEKISSPREAGNRNYCIRAELLEGEWMNIGGYRICRKDGKICTDRTQVYRNHTEGRLYAETPEIREGNNLEIYVNPNLIEIYINGGEYVLSNTVYDLDDSFSSDMQYKPEFALWNENKEKDLDGTTDLF